MSEVGIYENSLAVVIPAYKAMYFAECLESLASQTCQKFTVYVGDDGSPDDLAAIVDHFRGRLNIVYRRFETNLGGADLVAHWERCIDMVQSEEWIWFFSDDDRLEAGCVEGFFDALRVNPDADVFHFNVRVIDGAGARVQDVSFPDFPLHYQASDFYRDRVAYRQQSYLVEFVFRREKFLASGRFERFDLAWGTDVATCVKVAWPNGIVTVPGSVVEWRRSAYNISPNNSREMAARKLSAVVEFLLWAREFFARHGHSVPVSAALVYARRWIAYRGKNGFANTMRNVFALCVSRQN